MTRTSRTWTVETGGGALAGELHRVLDISHRQAKGLIDSGCVKVNGKDPSGHGHRLAVGDAVAVAWDPDTRYQVLPPARKLEGEPFKVLWEDEHLLFVDKPAGLLTVPAETGGEPSLADALVDHYRRRGMKRVPIYIVHRLDRWTSGVLVFAKTPEALRGLKDLFEAHRLQRVYHAILVGELPENSGSLFSKLVEHQKSLKVKVTKGQKGAKHAITHYRVLERLPGHTVVEVKLETGRRNQIRVQFADKGFPLLGDHVYGAESPLIERQALHAELLGLRHPVTDAQVTVSAKVPEDFEAALRALRNTRRVQRAEAGVKGEEGIFKPTITKEHKAERISRARTHAKPAGRREDGADRPRADRPRADRPRADRPRGAGPRPERSGSAAPRRDRRDEGAPRRDRSEDARPPRDRSGRPGPRREQPEGGAPRRERPARPGDRPGAGPARGSREGRPAGDRRPDRTASARPTSARPSSSRPSSSRGPRPASAKPRKPRG
ncbi:MAG: RluA family pseudouridine synthase [Holophagaceae bacterium]